ncbi:response regulator [Tumebacillus permanentifrigoris]|uniref:LuxR family two component transcriptional regulator n=1 Tax=Tumebacillus permanentifrigoris TaxID=378543 RepID=A0A316D7Y0_9BACL|nr:response regulator transcription factor [Tumebacillus permanentifrigoris]PWK05955.1 LuxR family two component transcriptional regulator [Tumebacillus permanentifrigoris]
MSNIRVLLVDDHDMVRLGVRTYLLTEPDVEIVGEANSGELGVELVQQVKPDVVLMDLVMGGIDGVQATREVLAVYPQTKVLVLTSYLEDEKVLPALEAGASGYLLKTVLGDELAIAIRKVFHGETVLEPQVAAKVVANLQKPKPVAPVTDLLTEREMDVLRLIGQGMTNQQIGETLYIGIKTVKTHVSNILAKLSVEDRTQAAILAIRKGWVDGESKKG